MGGVLRAMAWIVVLAALALGLALFSARPGVAATCPRCFGLSQVQDGLYVESSMAPAARDHAAETVMEAQQGIAGFYGEERFKPRVLVCASDACYHRVGGAPGSGTGSMGTYALVVAPEAVNKVAITEALAHVEMRGRVGAWKMEMGAVPEWFEQGLAVVVADDRLYLGPSRHCLAGSFPDMPATPSEWQEELEQEGDVLYAQSACQTVMWMDSHGGAQAVTDLLAKVGAGQEFGTLFK